ncbi:MAG TPA: DUF4292 domain-containing protein [Anaeromyxobacteraceae bacterium]|nr:DUF4292 domain-containing protein [Anaeromyxobacteraceae bacterium]
MPRAPPRHPAPRRGRERLATAVLLAIAACTRVPPPDLARDPTDLLREVEASGGKVQRVRGTARVRVASSRFNGSVLEFLAAEKPDRVRLETLDFFGNPAAVLVAAGGRFAYLDTRGNVYYRGEATPQNVAQLIPVAIPVQDLVTILCGSAPIVSEEAREVDVQGDRLALTLGPDGSAERLLIGEGARVVTAQVRKGAALVPGETADYHLEFGRFLRRSGVRFPGLTVLEAKSVGSKVELLWREDLEVGAPLDPALFRLEPPRGARIVDLAQGEELPAGEMPSE